MDLLHAQRGPSYLGILRRCAVRSHNLRLAIEAIYDPWSPSFPHSRILAFSHSRLPSLPCRILVTCDIARRLNIGNAHLCCPETWLNTSRSRRLHCRRRVSQSKLRRTRGRQLSLKRQAALGSARPTVQANRRPSESAQSRDYPRPHRRQPN